MNNFITMNPTHQTPVTIVDTMAKLPTNSFISWIKDKYKSHDITFDVKYAENISKVEELITIDDVNTWKNTEPIFISTQTGSGKTNFIMNTLSKGVLERNINNKYNERILILSNRIALNRQLKLAYAELIFKITGNRDAYDKLEEYYTFKGFDKFYMDFGDSITICSYHQLLERKILDNNHYDYIVCDEAHFFIQDSLFNHFTDDILHYIVNQGRNSIRIYMSATLNLAMESILREEYSIIEKENLKHKEYINNLDSLSQFLMSNIKIYLSAKIYYIKRNYNQIKDIYGFNDLDQLADTINHSKSKWLIFVKSSSDGELLEKKINKRSRVFISRKRIETDTNIEKTYDSIISNQYYNHDVLITTSILDNGINLLLDSKYRPIRNIVLFSLDKTQFLQMLGRVRTTKEKSLNLFLYEYSMETIEYYLNASIELLLKRLECDLWNLEERKLNYDLKYHKFVEDPNIFCDYNDCSIVKLIDTIYRLTDICEHYLLTNEKEKKKIDDVESIKNRLLMNLTTKWKYNHLYSGILYYIFNHLLPLDDCMDFENFFYKYILPDSFDKQAQKRLDQLLSFLTPLEKNMILKEYNGDTMEGISLAKRKLKEKGLIVETPIEDHNDTIKRYYIDAATGVHESNPIEEQLAWICLLDSIYNDSDFPEIKNIEEYHKSRT